MAKRIRARKARRAPARRRAPSRPRTPARRVRTRAYAPRTRARTIRRSTRRIRRNPRGWWQTPVAEGALSAAVGLGAGLAVRNSMMDLRLRYTWIPAGLPDWAVQALVGLLGVWIAQKFTKGRLRSNLTAGFIGFASADIAVRVGDRTGLWLAGMPAGIQQQDAIAATAQRALPPGITAGADSAGRVRERARALKTAAAPNGVKLA